MSSLPQIFNFEATDEIRGCTDAKGDPIVIASDICRTFGVKNVSDALSRLDPDEKGIVSIDTPGGKQNLAYVNESGFYALVLSFRLRKDHPNFDKAKRFRKWVTSEVLPAIRKTGRYETAPVAPRPKSTKSTLDLLAMGRILVDNLEKHAELEEFVHERDTYHEQRNRDLEARLARTQEELIQARSDSARAVRTVTSESGYFTLVTWAEQHGVYLTPPNDSIEGKVVKAMCLDRGIEPGQWKGPRYSVGTYPEHILHLWLDNYRGRGTSLRVASPA